MTHAGTGAAPIQALREEVKAVKEEDSEEGILKIYLSFENKIEKARYDVFGTDILKHAGHVLPTHLEVVGCEGIERERDVKLADIHSAFKCCVQLRADLRSEPRIDVLLNVLNLFQTDTNKVNIGGW